MPQWSLTGGLVCKECCRSAKSFFCAAAANNPVFLPFYAYPSSTVISRSAGLHSGDAIINRRLVFKRMRVLE